VGGAEQDPYRLHGIPIAREVSGMLRPEMVEPATVAEALRALRRTGAAPLAGATDLIPAMRKGEMRPRALVNLKCIPELSGITRTREGLRIGATTRVAELLESAAIAAAAPLLAEVAHGFGSAQIRAMATVGGNLCSATPSADLAPPLLVLDARAEIRGAGGKRELDLCDFFRGANRTILRRGEILTAIIVPRARGRFGAAYHKLCGRRAMDLSIAAVAAAVRLRGTGAICAGARVALGAVAPIPMRARAAEELLEGVPLTPALIEEAAAAAAKAARPVTDLRASAEYRRDMVRVLAARALTEALRRAEGGKA
jgi:CO/xanthine dehydrogenase FAD-binding subunit